MSDLSKLPPNVQKTILISEQHALDQAIVNLNRASVAVDGEVKVPKDQEETRTLIRVCFERSLSEIRAMLREMCTDIDQELARIK